MCFYVSRKHQKAKTARRDIPCYKILYKEMCSPYLQAYYLIGRLKTSDIIVKDASEWCMELGVYEVINVGLHSYSNKSKAKYMSNNYIIGSYIFKAIIPKGSKYYYNEDTKEYVSNQLIITEKL